MLPSIQAPTRHHQGSTISPLNTVSLLIIQSKTAATPATHKVIQKQHPTGKMLANGN
jgi:hypothetical protein